VGRHEYEQTVGFLQHSPPAGIIAFEPGKFGAALTNEGFHYRSACYFNQFCGPRQGLCDALLIFFVFAA
jgi:hypothetical protein